MRFGTNCKALCICGILLALSACLIESDAQEEYLGEELKQLSDPTPSATPTSRARQDFSFFDTAVTMFVVLILIIGLIILLGFTMKRGTSRDMLPPEMWISSIKYIHNIEK